MLGTWLWMKLAQAAFTYLLMALLGMQCSRESVFTLPVRGHNVIVDQRVLYVQ